MENHLENIDAYFSGSLNDEEKRVFETKIAEDKNFAEEIAFYLAAHEVAKEEVVKEKREWFRQLLKENPPSINLKQSTPLRRIGFYRIAAAAAVVGLLFLGWFLFFNQTGNPEEMASKFIKSEFSQLGVGMGKIEDSVQNGLNLYNNGKIAEAEQMFQSIIQRDGYTYATFNAIKWQGVIQLVKGNCDSALTYFKTMEKFDSLVANPAKFYQAVTLMKRNRPEDKAAAIQLLKEVSEKKLDGNEFAEQWLKKL
jgi:TolA-binding protein